MSQQGSASNQKQIVFTDPTWHAKITIAGVVAPSQKNGGVCQFQYSYAMARLLISSSKVAWQAKERHEQAKAEAAKRLQVRWQGYGTTLANPSIYDPQHFALFT